MPNHKQKTLKFITNLFLTIFILFVLFCLWLYMGNLTNYKIKIFSKFPLPIAFVNGAVITMADFNNIQTINQSINGIESSSETLAISYKAVIDKALIAILAQNKNIQVTSNEIDTEYELLSSTTPLEGKSSFQELLQSYRVSEQLYKNQVIKQDLLIRKLNIWFNSQKNLNPSAFSQANLLLSEVQSGQNIEVLAKLHSQDEASQSIGGDLGFLDITEILPELRDGILNLKSGNAGVFASRYGLHILKIEDIINNKIHLKQIFINTQSFNTWLNLEKSKIKTIKLLKI